MQRSKQSESVSKQLRRRVNNPPEAEEPNKGNFELIRSTGSTLLDLAVSGGRVYGGGLPAGILVEIFGPSSTGKTVLLSEIAGNVQAKGGDIIYQDPEARLDPRFAKMFGLDLESTSYSTPDTVSEVFETIKNWKPENPDVVNGIFVDSLAALSTNMELSDDGDPYGMRRSKEFSEGLRKTCREIKKRNYLMVCSNQVRDVIGAQAFQEKTAPTGGKAWSFYPSLRLSTVLTKKYESKIELSKKNVHKKIVGIRTEIKVYKSSIWEPYNTAPVTIMFDYGIDDIRENLQYIKDNTGASTYTMDGQNLNTSLAKSIAIIEDGNLETELREEVIKLWTTLNDKHKVERKPKH